MTAFIVCAALAVVLALYLTIGQLLRGRDPQRGAVRQLRAQLTSLAQAHGDGHVDKNAYARRKEKLAGELVELLEASPGRTGRSPLTALALAIVIPAITAAIYLQLGEPAALDPVNLAGSAAASSSAGTSNSAGAANANAPGMEAAVANLESRLQANPDDIEGWVLLGQSYATMSRIADARRAFERALTLDPEEPAIMEMLGQAIAMEAPADGVPADARHWFEEALERNPRSQRALFYLGFADAQDGNTEQALERWRSLYAQLDPEDANAQALRQEIDALTARMGDAPVPESGSASAEESDTPSGRRVTAYIDIADDLLDQVEVDDVLYVFARAAEGPPMPLAIQRLQAGQLPLTVVLDESMGMSAQFSLATFDEVVVGARISKTGNATPQPGDVQGLSGTVSSDGGEVNIVISETL